MDDAAPWDAILEAIDAEIEDESRDDQVRARADQGQCAAELAREREWHEHARCRKGFLSREPQNGGQQDRDSGRVVDEGAEHRVMYLDGLHQANDSPEMLATHRQIGTLAIRPLAAKTAPQV